MRAAFHRFLLMCLVLALPLEAFASASMLACALSHGAEPQPLASVAADVPPPCHAEEAPEQAPAEHDCTHCAACYLASALPIPARIVLPADQPAQDYAALSPARFAGFIPDGPERPPRPRLA